MSVAVYVVTREQGRVHWLHAGRTGERAHQPIVNALAVVGVHARQVSHIVSDNKLAHANSTPGNEFTKISYKIQQSFPDY